MKVNSWVFATLLAGPLSFIVYSQDLKIEPAVKLTVTTTNGVRERIETSTDLSHWTISSEWDGDGFSTNLYLDVLGSQKAFYRRNSSSYPTLVGIETGTNAVSLLPSFDPGIFRYTLSGSNTVGNVRFLFDGVGSTASIGGIGFLTNGQQVSLDLTSPRTVSLTMGGTNLVSSKYEFVILPSDFPTIAITNFVAADPSMGILMAFDTRTDSGNFIAICDQNGVPFLYRRTETGSLNFVLQTNGLFSYTIAGKVNEVGLASGVHVLLDPYFNEITRVGAVGLNHTDDHDVLMTDQGTYLTLAYPWIYRDYKGVSTLFEDTAVQEVDFTGKVLLLWNSWGSIPYEESTFPNKTDYAHGNSLFIDTDENILVSLRGVSQIVKLDRKRGNVLWKLGGQSSDFQFVNDPFHGTCGQHAAVRLPNGHLLVFDNRNFCLTPDATPQSRVVEYALDEVLKKATLIWSYSRPGFYTRSQGNSQRLDSGNTVICWGSGPPVYASEVTAEGKLVQDIVVRYQGKTFPGYRIAKYPLKTIFKQGIPDRF